MLAISNKEIICLQESDSLRSPGRLGGLSFAFFVKGVVNDKFAFENLMIAQTERAETMRNPAQTFAGGMGIGRMRVRGLHDLTQQKQRRFAQVVFFRIELNETSSS